MAQRFDVQTHTYTQSSVLQKRIQSNPLRFLKSIIQINQPKILPVNQPKNHAGQIAKKSCRSNSQKILLIKQLKILPVKLAKYLLIRLLKNHPGQIGKKSCWSNSQNPASQKAKKSCQPNSRIPAGHIAEQPCRSNSLKILPVKQQD